MLKRTTSMTVGVYEGCVYDTGASTQTTQSHNVYCISGLPFLIRLCLISSSQMPSSSLAFLLLIQVHHVIQLAFIIQPNKT